MLSVGSILHSRGGGYFAENIRGQSERATSARKIESSSLFARDFTTAKRVQAQPPHRIRVIARVVPERTCTHTRARTHTSEYRRRVQFEIDDLRGQARKKARPADMPFNYLRRSIQD